MLTRRYQQRGVSLIESMIALLVISIGLLGIAALQITAMKQNTSALNHSQAVWIGYNIADRIRANFGEFDQYAGIDTNSSYTQDCSTSACTAQQAIHRIALPVPVQHSKWLFRTRWTGLP